MRELRFKAWLPDENRWLTTFVIDKDGTLLGNDNKGTAILMQYTGLKDKNGKEIWEGDLVKFNNSVSEVYWHQPTCSLTNAFGEQCEVVGNIHENPSLLETKDA